MHGKITKSDGGRLSRQFHPLLLIFPLFLSLVAGGSRANLAGESLPTKALPVKTVLILDTFAFGEQFDSLEPLEATVRSHVPGGVNFQVEREEGYRYDEGYASGLVRTLRQLQEGAEARLGGRPPLCAPSICVNAPKGDL